MQMHMMLPLETKRGYGCCIMEVSGQRYFECPPAPPQCRLPGPNDFHVLAR